MIIGAVHEYLGTYRPRSLWLARACSSSDLFPEPATTVAAKSDLEWMRLLNSGLRTVTSRVVSVLTNTLYLGSCST